MRPPEPADHECEWRVTHYGPTGACAVEQACVTCGSIRFTGPAEWVAAMASLARVRQSMQKHQARMQDDIGQAIVDVKDRAIKAHSEAMRMRVGSPWEPIAQAIAFCGFVVADAQTGQRAKFRTWNDTGPEWTDNIFEATWYVRRADAERACLTDEDGWHILSVEDVIAEKVKG